VALTANASTKIHDAVRAVYNSLLVSTPTAESAGVSGGEKYVNHTLHGEHKGPPVVSTTDQRSTATEVEASTS
jgi:hypothetical protein